MSGWIEGGWIGWMEEGNRRGLGAWPLLVACSAAVVLMLHYICLVF